MEGRALGQLRITIVLNCVRTALKRNNRIVLNMFLLTHLFPASVLCPCLCRWNHVFQNPGVHTVEVAIYGKRRGGVQRSGPTLRSVLVVQQPIRGLQLAGPAHVGIHW